MRCVVIVFLLTAVCVAPAIAAPAELDERWDYYFNRINQQPASVLVDLALHRHLPIKAEPTLVWVLLPMVGPDPHGMGTAAEVKRLTPIEAELTDRLRRTLSARNVGRVRGEGQWQLYYYAPHAKGLDAAVRKALSTFPKSTSLKQEATSGSKSDPAWSFYTGVLYPSAERRQWIKDREAVNALQKLGDHVRAPRSVRHWAMFPDVAKQKLFETEVTKQKFVIDERTELMDDKYPLVIRFSRKDPVDLDAVHIVTEYLRNAALAVGGKYDGWVCDPVKTSPKKAVPPKKTAPPKKDTAPAK